MNNYQEILNYIKNIVLDEHADGYYQPKTIEHYYHTEIDALQELVELATPKYVTKHGNYRGYYYECPTCRHNLGGVYERKKNYCSSCGQRLRYWEWEQGKKDE